MHPHTFKRHAALAILAVSTVLLTACKKAEAPAPAPVPAPTSSVPAGTSPFVVGGSTSGTTIASPTSSMPDTASQTGTVSATTTGTSAMPATK